MKDVSVSVCGVIGFRAHFAIRQDPIGGSHEEGGSMNKQWRLNCDFLL